SPARSLAVLRAMIDRVDHEVLELFSRRNGLVAELAAYKREHGVPIRDPQREQQLIADRRDRAEPLGLSPEVVESIFRLILWASRDRQAALKAAVPLNNQPRTVAVIGGNGAMGSCMAQLFADLGHTVLITDLDTELTVEQAARDAEVVVLSVPIDVTAEVIQKVAPHVRKEALLMDVTSTKTTPVETMLKATQASVVGTHPLFGPSLHSLQGQRIVLVRGRGDSWFDWLKQMFEARGLTVLEATGEAHDRAMAIVQVLTHFSTEVLGKTLAQLGEPIQETMAFTSPIYWMELLMTARHFGQASDLYAAIQMSNPDTERVTQVFVETAANLKQTLANQDHASFDALFQEVRQYFGPFTEQALEQSGYLIDRLVERM
ncbi:MAG: bifunctional chorismate mutase/prephenate dehydrogenase, partial [Planctomycetota bacterium]